MRTALDTRGRPSESRGGAGAWNTNSASRPVPPPIELVGDPSIGERRAAVVEHELREARFVVQIVGIDDFFHRVARPRGVDEVRVLLRDVERDERQLRER
ncbi:hypothetical protein DM50_3800 [Burkholderia mallei]|nr:hypothetical protein DM50_3800 [Burkholderia mallei]